MRQLWKGACGVLFLIVVGVLTVSATDGHCSQGVSGDIFGRKTGMIHPFIGLSGTHTDNVTNASDNEESDYITVISPGVALAFPGTGNTEVRMNPSTAAPGGLSLSRQKLSTEKRFQGFLIYNPEIKMYDDNDDEDFTAQKGTCAFQYNAPGGLSVDIADKYQHTQEMWGETGNTTEHATYDANIVHGIIELSFSPRFSISAAGSFYTLRYKQDLFEFRDRDDSSFSGALNYHLSPKTRLFVEYKRIDIGYKESASEIRDSSEDFISAGISWDITAKSKGTCKFGYLSKNLDDSSRDDPSTWSGEIDISHLLSERSMITVSAMRGYFETNLQTANYYTTNRFDLSFSQALTGKIGASILLSYQNDDYEGVSIENDTYKIQPGITYSPYRWLSCQLSYSCSKRDSDQKDWEYTTNTFTFSITADF